MSENSSDTPDGYNPVAPPVPAMPQGGFGNYHSEDPAQQLGGPYRMEAPKPVAPKTNTLAIVSLVSAFLVSLVAVITGHIALRQIKRTGESGRGLALAGVVLGYLGLVIGAIVSTIMILSLVAVGSGGGVDSGSLQSPAPTETRVAGEALPSGVSNDFCEKFTVMSIKSQEMTGPDAAGKVPAEVLDAYTQLGAVESPNQQVYADFAKLLATSDVTTDTTGFDAAMEGFTTAMLADLPLCEKQLMG